MQWTKPGHEFDHVYEQIAAIYQEKEIVIYGAGMMGGRIYDAVVRLSDLKVIAFLDRDEKKTEYKGLPVYHTREEKERFAHEGNVVIVIGLPDSAGAEVKKELLSMCGAREEKCKIYSEFVMHDFPILVLYQKDKLFLDSVSMIVTEYCTLKCEKCAILLPYFKKVHAYPLKKLMEEADALFDKVDFVGNYTITGGEPLLYGELDQLLMYIGEHYRDRIGSFKLITNGTLPPKEGVLHAMCQYDMAVEISDYTTAVPTIKTCVEEVRKVFEQAGIQTYFLSAAQWVDFGFETVDNQYSPEQLQSFFNYCHTRCRGYVDGRLLYCINAYFAERTLQGREDEKNAFDIASMSSEPEERKRLLEFDLGYNKEGFLNMCQHCNGTVEVNQNYIEVGKQCVSH